MPPVVWLCLIALMGTDLFAGNRTYMLVVWLVRTLHLHVRRLWLLHIAVRKLGHFSGYAVLGALLFHSWRGTLPERRQTVRGVIEASWNWRWMALSIVTSVVSASLDEYHQSFSRYRTASWRDVALDTMGVVFANLLILTVLIGRTRRFPSSSAEK